MLESIQSKAILVHRHEGTKNIDVTTHAVLPVEGGQYTLGAGRAMTQADKEALTSILLNEERGAEFLEESMLTYTRSMICWYRKPEVREIPFKGHGKLLAPLPGLIFVASSGEPLRCFAYKAKGRPTLDTALFFAPIGNGYSGGSFCTGNVDVPRDVSKSNIPVWERFILDATNTHIGGVEPIKNRKGFDGMVSFYKELADAKAKAFPVRSLVQAKYQENRDKLPMTLRVLLGGIS